MRFPTTLVVAALLIVATSAQAATGKISKFLPHYLDHKGRHTLSPSLYERDAYQARLRSNPELVSGIRFDFKWSARGADRGKLRVRIEIRGSKTTPGNPFVVEQPVNRKGFFGRWSSVTVEQADFEKVGKMIAWRVTLLEEGQELAQQRSFLWRANPEETGATSSETAPAN